MPCFSFAGPSSWAVGLLALFGPCVGACMYSVCGTALHVPLCHSQVFPGNFSPDFFCFFLLRGAARDGLGDGDGLRGGQFAFKVPPPFSAAAPLGDPEPKNLFLKKLLQPLGIFLYSLPAADFWVVRGHVVGGMASLHNTFISGAGVWDANYAPSPLQVSRYASA